MDNKSSWKFSLGMLESTTSSLTNFKVPTHIPASRNIDPLSSSSSVCQSMRFAPILKRKSTPLSVVNPNYVTPKKQNYGINFTKSTPGSKHRSFASSVTSDGGKTGSTSAPAKSPGSTVTSTSSSVIVLSITEGRGEAQGEIGIAWIDLTHPVLYLNQFSDSQHYWQLQYKLSLIDPKSIILPQTIVNSTLASIIHESDTMAKMFPTPRQLFCHTSGLKLITRIASRGSTAVITSLHNQYYALAAVSALIQFLENPPYCVTFMTKSLPVFESNTGEKDFLKMDHLTIKHLELVKPNSSNPALENYKPAKMRNSASGRAPPKCLLDLVNHTVTYQGGRTLRSAILQPSCDIATISARQEAVAFLALDLPLPDVEGEVMVAHEDNGAHNCEGGGVLTRLRRHLKSFANLTPLTNLLVIGGVRPSETLTLNRIEYELTSFKHLQDCLRLYVPLMQILVKCSDRSELLKAYGETLTEMVEQEYRELRKIVDLLSCPNASQYTHKLSEIFPNRNFLHAKQNKLSIVQPVPSFREQLLGLCASNMEENEEQRGPQIDVDGDDANLLDISRRTAVETVQDMLDLARSLAFEQDIETTDSSMLSRQSIRLSYNTVRGFHLQMTAPPYSRGGIKLLPKYFTKPCVWKSICFFTTNDLDKLNNRMQGVLEEIAIHSHKLFRVLLPLFRKFADFLFKVIQIVGQLDMLCSLAFVVDHTKESHTWCPAIFDVNTAISSPSSSPTFIQPRIRLQQFYHPLISSNNSGSLVKNDIVLSSDRNVLLITGPNNCGKSCLLRAVGLCVILAQIGSHVPAKIALLGKPFARLASRFSYDDCLETNSSTFTQEAREMCSVFGEGGLSLLDEFGRSCQVCEGVALAFSTLEYLAHMPSSMVIFSTHFTQLAALAQLYPNVCLRPFKVVQSAGRTKSSSNDEFLDDYHDVEEAVVIKPTHELAECQENALISRTLNEVVGNLCGDESLDESSSYASSRTTLVDYHYGLELAAASQLPREIIEEARKFVSTNDANTSNSETAMTSRGASFISDGDRLGIGDVMTYQLANLTLSCMDQNINVPEQLDSIKDAAFRLLKSPQNSNIPPQSSHPTVVPQEINVPFPTPSPSSDLQQPPRIFPTNQPSSSSTRNTYPSIQVSASRGEDDFIL